MSAQLDVIYPVYTGPSFWVQFLIFSFAKLWHFVFRNIEQGLFMSDWRPSETKRHKFLINFGLVTTTSTRLNDAGAAIKCSHHLAGFRVMNFRKKRKHMRGFSSPATTTSFLPWIFFPTFWWTLQHAGVTKGVAPQASAALVPGCNFPKPTCFWAYKTRLLVKVEAPWASRLTRKPNNFSANRSWPSWAAQWRGVHLGCWACCLETSGKHGGSTALDKVRMSFQSVDLTDSNISNWKESGFWPQDASKNTEQLLLFPQKPLGVEANLCLSGVPHDPLYPEVVTDSRWLGGLK